MADITIDATAAASHTPVASHRTLVWTSATVGYYFYVDSDLDFKYTKTSDGGQTWGAVVTILTGSVQACDVWFDKWTPGITGTVIHTVYQDSNNLYYRSLDTNGDSLGTEVTVINGGVGNNDPQCSVVKAQGGNLYAFWSQNDGATFVWNFERSTDAGATFGARSVTGFDEGDNDFAFLVPADTSDNQDIAAIFIDRTANAISVKMHDDSANTWTETAIAALIDHASTVSRDQAAASVRLSDKHVILAFHNDRDTATADLKAYDLTLNSITTPTVTAKTDIATDKDDMQSVVVTIDQNTDDIYVGYIGKSDGSETLGTSVGIYYAKSTDDAATWESVNNVYSDTVTNNNATALYGSLGGTNFLVAFAWFEDTDDDIFYNYANRVTIAISLLPIAGMSELLQSMNAGASLRY